jgi:hypothetical protein
MMMRAILVTAAALASVSFSPGHAVGAAAPWCAVIELAVGSVYWDCQYHSFEDCYRRGNILAGNRGFCNHSRTTALDTRSKGRPGNVAPTKSECVQRSTRRTSQGHQRRG